MAFSQASNFVVNGPLTVINKQTESDWLKPLFEYTYQEARHRSRAQEVATHCSSPIPASLIPFVDAIASWVVQPDNPFAVTYVSVPGPKTNLAQLCAQRVINLGEMVASFLSWRRGQFLWWRQRRTDAARFFPTISYQFTTLIPAYKDSLGARLRDDPGLVSKCLEDQLSELIVTPFQHPSCQQLRPVIIVEGLEEIRSTQDQLKIVNLILAAPKENPAFRWLIFGAEHSPLDALLKAETHATYIKWEGQQLLLDNATDDMRVCHLALRQMMGGEKNAFLRSWLGPIVFLGWASLGRMTVVEWRAPTSFQL